MSFPKRCASEKRYAGERTGKKKPEPSVRAISHKF
jgi:hypothetical protein